MTAVSEETQELLDRAQRAIDRSIQLRAERAAHLKEAQQKFFEVELRQYRFRAAVLGRVVTR